MKTGTHEDYSRSHDVKGSSDRTFGIVLGLFFLLIGLTPLRTHRPIRWWALAISFTFLVLALVRPPLLHPLNQLWIRLGVLLGKIVNPIVTALLFYLVFTPVGIMLRLLGKDPLHLKFDATNGTYWKTRVPPGPPPESMANQF
jgi:hypothetical protein